MTVKNGTNLEEAVKSDNGNDQIVHRRKKQIDV
jgi:hypothetical protein